MRDGIDMTQPLVFGRLKAFEPEGENISTYLERVQLYFETNAVEDGKKASVLLTVIGAKNYGIIRSLVTPILPREKTFEELANVLKAHFQQKPLLIAERYRFYQRTQAIGESVQDYVADLRRLAITCEFGDFLDQALRDRFVCGLKTDSIQKRLLAEDGLTITRALEIAQGMEAAAANAKDLKVAAGSTPILQTSLTTTCCHRCGKNDHQGWDCRFRQAKCHKCGKIGHIAPVCRSRAKKTVNRHKGYRQRGCVQTSVIDTAAPRDLKQLSWEHSPLL